MESQKQESASSDQPMQSIAFSEALAQCLCLLAAVFRAEITESVTSAYAIGLDGLEGFQLVRATKWLLAHHREFMPTPAEIRVAVRETQPPEPATAIEPQTDKPPCQICHGSGYKLVPRPDSQNSKWAVTCDCRKKSS